MFIDQMGRKVKFDHWPPRRIVSLVPSQTEFLADLGLEQEVVGITKFCIHPSDWFQQKNRVGGTKTLNFQKIEALNPDLIIGNKEENDQAQIEALAQKYPVWMSDIYTLEDALEMMQSVGELVGKPARAQAIVATIQQQFLQLQAIPTPAKYPLKAAYLIWRKPFMAAGSGTFIDDLLTHAGFENVFKNLSRYPEISHEQFVEEQPPIILLSSEPYPFAKKHMAELQEICPESRIMLVNGELFSWYGSRLLQAPEYFEVLRTKL